MTPHKLNVIFPTGVFNAPPMTSDAVACLATAMMPKPTEGRSLFDSVMGEQDGKRNNLHARDRQVTTTTFCGSTRPKWKKVN